MPVLPTTFGTDRAVVLLRRYVGRMNPSVQPPRRVCSLRFQRGIYFPFHVLVGFVEGSGLYTCTDDKVVDIFTVLPFRDRAAKLNKIS